MKNIFKLFVLSLIGASLILSSCKKERSDDTTTPSTPSDYTITTVVGMVYDQNHDVLSDVEISLGNKTLTTNSDGSFIFNSVTVNKDRFLAKFKKANYFETVKTEKTIAGGITQLNVAMILKSTSSSISFLPENGGDIDMFGEGKIHFPAGLSYVDENNNPYTGNITVNAKYLDASSLEYSRFAPGGDQFGILTSNNNPDQAEKVYLMSIGGMLIELSNDNGDLLNLANDNDSLVKIETVIPSLFVSIAPDTIDNWYTGDNLAYASNEGSGRKEGGKYISQVEHFSYWSMQIPYTGSATIKGTVSDVSGNPVSGVRVNVGQSYAVTDNNGHYSRVVPAGIPGFIVQVLSTDYNNFSSNQVTQAGLADGETSIVDLVINIPSGDMIAVTGTLVGCNGQSLAGKVLMQNGSYTTQTYTQNGSFRLLIPVGIPSIAIQCQVGDNTKEVWIYPTTGDYDAGNIIICPPTPPPTGSNEININGDVYNNFTESTAHAYQASETTVYINMSSDNNDYVSFEISNYTGVGNYTFSTNDKATANISINGVSYGMHTGTLVVNQDQGAGGRFIGTFSGTAGSGETITGKFNAFKEADSTK